LLSKVLTYPVKAQKIETKQQVDELTTSVNPQFRKYQFSGNSYSLEACKAVSSILAKAETIDVKQ
jgi:uncharacterized protein YjaG (DUF416 family)